MKPIRIFSFMLALTTPVIAYAQTSDDQFYQQQSMQIEKNGIDADIAYQQMQMEQLRNQQAEQQQQIDQQKATLNSMRHTPVQEEYSDPTYSPVR